mgnify:FL=1
MAAAPVFDGAYILVPEASDTVRHAIDRAVRQFPFLLRPIARSRLERVNPVHARFSIEETAAGFRIDFGEGGPVLAPADGSPVPWTRPDGERLLLSVARDGGDLVQTFVAEDGRRENRFRFQDDGTLALYVTIESPRLAAPVTYRLIYRRAPPEPIERPRADSTARACRGGRHTEPAGAYEGLCWRGESLQLAASPAAHVGGGLRPAQGGKLP